MRVFFCLIKAVAECDEANCKRIKPDEDCKELASVSAFCDDKGHIISLYIQKRKKNEKKKKKKKLIGNHLVFFFFFFFFRNITDKTFGGDGRLPDSVSKLTLLTKLCAPLAFCFSAFFVDALPDTLPATRANH
jgi:hypothetical protein